MANKYTTVSISVIYRDKLKEIGKAQHRKGRGALEFMIDEKYKELFKTKRKK